MTRNFSIVLLAIVLIISSNSSFLTEAKNGGVTFDLIRGDSPKSSFHSPLLDHFPGSLDRANQFAPTELLLSSTLSYLINVSYGTPPLESNAVFDINSDLSWTQCEPCTNCYPQEPPTLDPKNSSTFKPIPCNTKTCQDSPGAKCAKTSNACEYRAVYADDESYTSGELATETITLGGTNGKGVSFPDLVFGCGHDNGGSWPREGSGVVGFGPGKVSLFTRLSSSIHGKFSYCLGLNAGKLNIGDAVSGVGVVSTPLILDPSYTLTLEAISVDDTRLEYPKNGSLPPTNNIMIASKPVVSFLPTEFYQQFASTVEQRINSTKTVPDPLKLFTLCYPSRDGLTIPKITLHFKGADLKLNPVNTFVYTTYSSLCLAFRPHNEVIVLGNLQQLDFWVGYDVENKIVSFKPADCDAA